MKTSLFPSLPPKRGRGGGGGVGGGTRAAFPWRARPPTPHKLTDHRRFRGKKTPSTSPTPPPPPYPPLPTPPSLPPLPTPPPPPLSWLLGPCPEAGFSSCLGLGATPPPQRFTEAQATFGSFELTSAFKPFNYAPAWSAA